MKVKATLFPICLLVSVSGLAACGSSGFEGGVIVNVLDGQGGNIESTDGGKTCTDQDFLTNTFSLKDSAGNVISIGTSGMGSSDTPLTLGGRTVYVSCKGIPVNFVDIPSGVGPYQFEINGQSPRPITEEQLKSGDLTVQYSH